MRAISDEDTAPAVVEASAAPANCDESSAELRFETPAPSYSVGGCDDSSTSLWFAMPTPSYDGIEEEDSARHVAPDLDFAAKFDEAMTAYLLNDSNRALRLFREALEIDPNHTECINSIKAIELQFGTVAR